MLDLDKWCGPSAPTYNLISILNVLDRCDKPRTLLSQAYGQLEIGGLLVIALVLPFAPFVEQGILPCLIKHTGHFVSQRRNSEDETI